MTKTKDILNEIAKNVYDFPVKRFMNIMTELGCSKNEADSSCRIRYTTPENNFVFQINPTHSKVSLGDATSFKQYLKWRIEKETKIDNSPQLDEKIQKEIKLDSGFQLEAVSKHKAHLYPSNYPEFRATVTFNETGNGHQARLNAATDDMAKVLPSYLKGLNELVNEHGAQITRTHDSLSITVPDYKFRQELNFKNSDFKPLEALAKVKDELDERYLTVMTEYESTQQQLHKLGFRQLEKNTVNKVEYIHEYLPQISFAIKGNAPLERVSIADIQYAHDEIEAANIYKTVVDKGGSVINHLDNRKKINLDLGIPKTLGSDSEPHNIFIIDTCTIKDLKGSNSNNRTWLDTIHGASQLPNVSIELPEIVADWELRNRISIIDESNSRLSKRILKPVKDASGKELRDVSVMQEFCSKLSRRYTDKNGETIIERSENPNIHITETNFTAELNKLNLEKYWHDRPELSHQVHAVINKKDLGEAYCGERATDINYKNCNIYIITSDITFLRKVEKGEVELANKAGNPITFCSTGTFCEAIMADKQFAAVMKQTYGHELDNFNLSSLQASINSSRENSKEMPLLEIQGSNSSGIKAPKLNEVITKGSQMALDHLNPTPQPQLMMNDNQLPLQQHSPSSSLSL